MRKLLTLTLVLSSLYIQAQIITDRPDQTEASSTIEKGSLQIETGILIQKTDALFTESVLPTTLFRLGLTKGFELRLQHEYAKFSGGGDALYGFNDIQLGFKAQLLKKEDVNTEIAFLSHVSIPTGTNFFTADQYGTVNKLSISHELNSKMGLGYNIGYDHFDVGSLTYSIALGYAINDNMGVYIEAFGDYLDFDVHSANMDAGLSYLVRDNLQLDFSFGTGINNDMNYLAFGFSWNIPPKKE